MPFKIADIMEKYIDSKYAVSYFGVLSLDLSIQPLSSPQDIASLLTDT